MAWSWIACWRLLTFRITRDELAGLDGRHLRFGLVCTWIVGMGRWWDDVDAGLLQHLGVGSVAYVFVLAAIVWLVVLPLRPLDWSYRRVLTFVCLTSPPAALYAVPVERFTSMEAANSLNLAALAIVAAWRVALLYFVLFRLARLRVFEALVAGLLPLTGIVAGLFALNLHRVVFNIMGSMSEADKTAHDAVYGILFVMTMFSMVVFPVSLLLHGVNAYLARKKPRSV